MGERRPFPPSPRRRALARAAGLTSASPLLAGAGAMVAACLALPWVGRAALARLGAWVALAAGSAAHASLPAGSAAKAPGAASRGAPHVGAIASTTLELAAPLLVAAALAAAVVHVVQTRALWLPRRRVAGAPSLPPHDASRTLLELAGVSVIGAVALAWLWTAAPQLPGLVIAPVATGEAIERFVLTLALAGLALGALDLLVRHARLDGALAMTLDEKRQDDRLSAADPRWRDRRRSAATEATLDRAVARAAVLLLGDDSAIAIDWHPIRQPVPARIASGRQARATQLLALARRYRVPVHRDVALVSALGHERGPVPDAQWARLAEIVAAVGGARSAERPR